MPSTITIEQLVDIVQADLTFSGLVPKVLPDLEIERIIREKAIEWFYKNYQFSLQKMYYFLKRDCIESEEYTQMGYITLPEGIESIVRIAFVNDPSLFRIGIEAPNLSINFGVTNQPYLTSFVSTVSELGVYRSILSSFSDELNKMSRNFVKHHFNHISKRLNFLDSVRTNMVLETYTRIPQETLFDNVLFKDYVIGLCRVRLAEALTRFTFNLPGGFNYSASELLAQGNELITKVEEKVKSETNAGWFYMSK